MSCRSKAPLCPWKLTRTHPQVQDYTRSLKFINRQRKPMANKTPAYLGINFSLSRRTYHDHARYRTSKLSSAFNQFIAGETAARFGIPNSVPGQIPPAPSTRIDTENDTDGSDSDMSNTTHMISSISAQGDDWILSITCQESPIRQM